MTNEEARPEGRALVYRPELDAVRGIAVLLVLGGHFLLPGLGGAAHVGVTIFFVLSGYLITGILLRGPSLRTFYARRARRLLPALFVWLAVLVLVGTVTLRDTLPTILYVANVVPTVPPLGHTWSLSAEEQFYFLWPWLIALARPRWFLYALVVAGPVIRLVSADPLLLSLSRFDAIALGCLIALRQASSGVRATEDAPRAEFSKVLGGSPSKSPRGWAAWMYRPAARTARANSQGRLRDGLPIQARSWLTTVAPAIGVALLAGCAILGSPGGDPLAFTLAAWGSALVIGHLVTRGTGPLAIRPLIGVGRISYGLYLWHFPIALAVQHALYSFDGTYLHPITDRPTALAWTLGGIALSFACAIVSWFVVERPILSGQITLKRSTVMRWVVGVPRMRPKPIRSTVKD